MLETIDARNPRQQHTQSWYGVIGEGDVLDPRWITPHILPESPSPSSGPRLEVQSWQLLIAVLGVSTSTSWQESLQPEDATSASLDRPTLFSRLNLVRTRTLQARFDALAEEWKRDMRTSSSTTEMAMHPAYQQIIGMGERALPFIFRELEGEPDHWFWALKAITGEDPVPVSARGRIGAMRRAWLGWGSRKGY